MSNTPTNRLPLASGAKTGRPSGPLFGRESILEVLRTQLERTQNGEGNHIALMGESGLGKTRLAHQLADEARTAGIITVYIPMRGSKLRPYEPMADYVRGLLDIDPNIRREAQRVPLAQGLSGIGFPQFEPTFARLLRIEGSGPMPTAASLAEADDIPVTTLDGPIEDFDFDGTVQDMKVKFELGDMLSLLLQGVAGKGKPILVIFDDLDEAAELSRAMALRQMENIEKLPILIVATFRPTSPRDVRAAFVDSTLELSPLSSDQALELGAALMDMTWLDKELSDLIWKNAGGNPLLIEMLMEHLRDTGRLTIRSGDHLGELLGEGDVPSDREIVVARIRRLPPELLKTILNAVVLGDGFRTGALGTLYESRSEDDLLNDLNALIELGLLERSGTGHRAIYRFPQSLVRDTLYETAPEERRAQMHQRAAYYYALPLPGRRPRTESIVYHFARSGNVQEAIAAIDNALDRAYQQGSREQIIALYQEALNIVYIDPELAARQNEFAEAVGDLYAVQHDYNRAWYGYQQADMSESSILLHAKAGLALLAVDPAQAVKLMAQVTLGIPLEYEDDLRWRLEAGHAWGLALMGRTYDAVRKTRDALSVLSGSAGLGSARTMMRGALGMALYYHGEEAEAQPHLESARAGYHARGDEAGVLFVNQVLIGMPRNEITQAWLDLMLGPLIRMA